MATIPDILDTMDYGPAPEDASFAHDWLAAHDKGFGHFIGGAFTKPGKKSFKAKNPATGEALATLAQGTKGDVNKAVKAARAALPAWQKLSGHARAKHLYSLARIVQKESRFLAVLDTLDNGKPIRETRDIDIPLVARHFYHYAGWAQTLESVLPGAQPYGVCGQIIPWNFPLLMLAWKVAPALATGNTVVLKPAEYTSLSALYFAELAQEVGIPDGVINIVTGDGETGTFITSHPDVDKIAFTGSTEVGKSIAASTAGSGKALSLELGGKSPFIVFDDADLDSAVEGLVDAIFFNQGEVCCAGSRLLVQEGVEDALIAKLKARLATFRIGDPLDKAIDMGAMADPVQVKRARGLIEAAVGEGACVWQPEVDHPAKGAYHLPTLLTDVDQTNIAVREEIFGPVLTIQSFRTLGEAATLANNTRYGLAAAIWSENIGRCLDVAGRLKAGVIWINTANQFDAAAPFGGYKESGYGREGGLEGLRAYVKTPWPWVEPRTSKSPKPVNRDLQWQERTIKNFIGGKQTRNDNGRTRLILSREEWDAGEPIARVGIGNRKDIRNAVEAASRAQAGWAQKTGHERAQILYFLQENIEHNAGGLANALHRLVGINSKPDKSTKPATWASNGREVMHCDSRIFSAAAWADKFDGRVHSPPKANITLGTNEPVGVVGIVCPNEAPLLNFLTMVTFAVAAGNTVVAIPSYDYPIAATELVHILEASDIPPGVINIVTGEPAEMTKTLAEHDAVDALWVHADADTCAMAERAGAVNMKRIWASHGKALDWADPIFDGDALMRLGSEVKTIWLPYGE